MKIGIGRGNKIHRAEFMAWADEGFVHIPLEFQFR